MSRGWRGEDPATAPWGRCDNFLVDVMVDWLVVGRYDSLVHVIGGRWSVDVMDELVDIIRWLV